MPTLKVPEDKETTKSKTQVEEKKLKYYIFWKKPNKDLVDSKENTIFAIEKDRNFRQALAHAMPKRRYKGRVGSIGILIKLL